MSAEKILLDHGSGGRLMHKLIRELLLKKLYNPVLKELSDSATVSCGKRLAFTTDSFVVAPLFFPGGDIGKLAVCGTVNDLLMSAAIPQYLSLAMIIEEGLELRILERIIDSIAREAKGSNILVATGDLKVVERGSCDKMFINTSGVGSILEGKRLSMRNIEAGDRVIVTGNVGEHGLAVLSARKGVGLGLNINSDCCALGDLLIPLLKKIEGIKFMRDPTRGGLATTLNEISADSGLGIAIEEKKIPVSGKVKAACELLGIDPLYVANEGKAVIVVRKNSAAQAISFLKKHPLAGSAAVIGEVVKKPKARVVLHTSFGTQRILDMPEGEPLPRIC